ncbi:FecR family protein [Aquimarina sediminis]|uniref:FecR family protein n=1 Tax=Aquimarina sediminis TaxID=2070536 RepID=UPI000CA02C9C|nr:FecR domain-containing protein [Aquimarina sediminis]
MQEKDLIKYIKGAAKENEKKAVIEWIRKDTKHQKQFNLLKANYVASTLDSYDGNSVEAQYEQFSSKRSKSKVYYYTAMCSSIVIPLIMVWYLFSSFPNTNFVVNTTDFFGSNTNEVITQQGDHKMVTLPDGSTVVLNAGSRLTYPEKFKDNIRKVTLVGEAFFDIKRDINKPFFVNTDDINIKVLGTSFNVKSYPDDEKIETTLITGKVEIFQQQKEQTIVLEPSQRAVFDREKSNIVVDKVNSIHIIAWQKGKLIFDKTPLKQVVLDLNRKYDVEFVINSDSLLQYKYTGEFDNLTLEEVLELLRISSPISYEFVGGKIMLNSE